MAFDQRRFRDAAGTFATGVTVVTTLDAAGEPSGLTVNSFTSVSLDPPMVLFCLGKESATFEAFSARNGFAVNVLSASQAEVSDLFARPGADRFSGVDWVPGYAGLPVLVDALAAFECTLAHDYDGGDHRILVGTVREVRWRDTDEPALGYFRSRYAAIQTPPDR